LSIWAYESFDTLKLAIEDILFNYGSKYLISFSGVIFGKAIPLYFSIRNYPKKKGVRIL